MRNGKAQHRRAACAMAKQFRRTEVSARRGTSTLCWQGSSMAVHLFRVSRRGAERRLGVLRHRDALKTNVYEYFQGSMLVPRCRRGQRARSACERQTLNRSATAHPKLLCDGAALRAVACVSRFVSQDSYSFCGLRLEIRVSRFVSCFLLSCFL